MLSGILIQAVNLFAYFIIDDGNRTDLGKYSSLYHIIFQTIRSKPVSLADFLGLPNDPINGSLSHAAGISLAGLPASSSTPASRWEHFRG